MTKHLLHKTSMLLMCLLLSITVWSQQFKDGVRTGQIKVKFTPEMSAALSQVTVTARTSGFTTGLASVDQAAKATEAKNMYRLFPYDAKHEAKLRKHGLHLWYVIEVDDDTDPKAAAARFRQLKEVAVAEVEREKKIAPYKVTPHTTGPAAMSTLPFNDPLLKDQWHYNNTNQTGYGDADVNLFEAWATTTGASNIIVSVHDEGVDVKHADLKANIWTNTAELNGTAGVDDDGNGYIDDVNGWNFQKKSGAIDPQYHGTHVAGTIAAVNNNGIGVAGVAGGNGTGNGVKIMSMQILGGGSIEKSFIYAAHNGAVISQNSWGYSNPGAYEQSVIDAIDYFIDEAGDFAGSPMKGGIVIFAAGNSNWDAQWYPGYHEGVLAVSAIGPEWKKAEYSNYGNWIEIAAPGGDQQTYGGIGGVLSTIPNGNYAYMEGTSMACPHVSGIAALALANRTRQLTNDELWGKLITGVVNIDEQNPDYMGMLGTGAIDAKLAIQNDLGIAPAAISDLTVTGVAQEFINLTWTVPADEDDQAPTNFQLYIHTEPITTANIHAATKLNIKNNQTAGSEFFYEVADLLGLTTYYVAVTSTDRWGNISGLSNIQTTTTNEGPSIAVDENSQSINLSIDVTGSATATHNLTILNNANGILRWNHLMRHKNTSLAFNASALHYPQVITTQSTGIVGRRNVVDNLKKAATTTAQPVPMAFEPVQKQYTSWATHIIGDTDINLTNSAAAKFYVSEPNGFNLTQARMYLKHDPALGPVIMEVYKGSAPVKANLVYAQEHSNWSASESWAYITLNEQLYFEQGSTFWLVFHVPSGNLYPLGMGYELDEVYSTYCYISFNLGNTWTSLEDAIESKDYAWTITADSYNEHLGTYLTLEPGSGDVQGLDQVQTLLTANASTLINGNYSANVVLTSNDAQNRELRIPVNLEVTGHKPNLKHIDIADFGAVFVGTEKSLDLIITNDGYGNFNNPMFSINGTQFEIDGYAPWQINAREEVVVKVKYKPTSIGNTNDVLTFTNGDQTYQILLVGIGAETSKIQITPESQIVNNIIIGDQVSAQLTVENTGAYPLRYFIPGFDSKGVSNNWPTDYHTYGYKFRTNYGSEANPIPFEFQDISTTGVDITGQIKDDTYYTLDMGFEFPYYSESLSTIYIARKGFTTFDTSVRPINSPTIPGNEWTPKGYISLLGTYLNYVSQGQIFYQVEADRVIIQYDNVWDGWTFGQSITAQMVLYANGDIRFFYETLEGTSPSYFSILMEDLNQSDGILVNNWNKQIDMYSGLALGFDYPGPNMITAIENGSGIISPGSSATVTVQMNTSSLNEGIVNRYINFISNDPFNAQKSALIQLEINAGGVAQPLLSTDTIAFGNVFQSAIRSTVFTIKNPGSADVDIASITSVNDAFILTGDHPTTIKPKLYKKYDVSIPTASLATLEDWLSINYSDGTHDTIYVTGNVVVPPAINVDLSLLQETLAYGETSSHPFNIENTGLANLEVATTAKQWLAFNTSVTPTGNTYAVEKYNDGSFYQWIDIRQTGTQMSFVDFEDFDGTFWRELDLPFPIEFYGVTYTSMKVGDNGIISFEDEPQASFFTDYIPSQSHPGPCIMPYWTFSGFSDYLYPIEDIGIFYQFYADKFIITWSYFTNNFGGMGDPVSAQAIFYKNGTMKFQYKREEGGADLTSHFGTIGLQKDNTTGIAISEYEPLDHGSGLAFIIAPIKQYTVSPGSTLNGEIVFDASNIYGGVYTGMLKIMSNVPNSELLEKPVELTVTGEAVPNAADTLDAGRQMVMLDGWSYKSYYSESQISNNGSAPLQLTWAQLADGNQSLDLQVWALVDGWFGQEWRWASMAELWSPWGWPPPATLTVNPGEALKVRAAFTPSMAGTFLDSAMLTTNLGNLKIVLAGTGFEPPALSVDETPIEVVMNTMTETTSRFIAFDNINGLSELNYEVSIDFGRAEATSTSGSVTVSGTPVTLVSSGTGSAIHATSVAATSSYNRTISHTDKTAPETFVGTGGSAPFTLATRYNAGAQGFNLSHVETWFRTETATSGSIHVEIMAGGSSLANAVKLAEGSITFAGSGNDNEGAWYAIAMDQAARIYPNEDFYVVITYPLGIQFPQGTLTNEPETPGRYFYYSEGNWFDVQSVSGFGRAGWLMFAAEETAANSSWLTITSALSGTLAAGEASGIDLEIDGAVAQRGDQVAYVVLKSNDPARAEVRVPVTLHMNEAPSFTNVPEVVFVAEGDEVVISIPVVDAEGHSFTVQAAQSYAGVTHTFESGVLSITLTPDFGTAGNVEYSFTATDEFNAAETMNLQVEIEHTNQAPAYIGSTDPMEHAASGELVEYSIDDFFADPDDDEYSFTLATGNSSVVQVFSSANQFLIKPIAMGSTNITFTVTDIHGATTTHSIAVEVVPVLGIEDRDVKFSISVYPNPVIEKVWVDIQGEVDNQFAVRVFNTMGVTLMKSEHASGIRAAINLSHLPKGIYFVEVKDRTGRSTRRIVKE